MSEIPTQGGMQEEIRCAESEMDHLKAAKAQVEQLILLNQLMAGVIRELGRIGDGLAARNR